jgi:hypothetical protein
LAIEHNPMSAAPSAGPRDCPGGEARGTRNRPFCDRRHAGRSPDASDCLHQTPILLGRKLQGDWSCSQLHSLSLRSRLCCLDLSLWSWTPEQSTNRGFFLISGISSDPKSQTPHRSPPWPGELPRAQEEGEIMREVLVPSQLWDISRPPHRPTGTCYAQLQRPQSRL